jgi:class 3 adenylate cyclase
MEAPPVQYTTTNDGVSIAYWSLGEGVPVIHMPPIPWSHLELEWRDPGYRRWFEALAPGKQLVRYDNRGSGLSDRAGTDWSLDAFLPDIDAVADRLGLQRFVLAGISVGSPVAIAYAARHPERVSRLILWCPVSRTADFALTPGEALQALRATNWDLYLQTTAHAMVAGWEAGEAARQFAAIMRGAVEPSELVEAWQFDLTDELPKITCPTLVMHRREAVTPPVDAARHIASRIPDANLVLLEGGAILPWVGDMDTVIRAVDDFLGTVQQPQAPPQTALPSAAPSAMATILFTDIEGSTAITQRLGDAKAREVMREHERITREALKAHGGSEVKTMGDGFMASFASATKALDCAIAIQRVMADWNAGVGAVREPPLQAVETVRVRIGLNAGEPIAEEDPDGRGDLFGTAVITAARIAAKASGGEVLASNVVRELVAGKGYLFADRGEVALRGFDDPVRVYELRWQEED